MYCSAVPDLYACQPVRVSRYLEGEFGTWLHQESIEGSIGVSGGLVMTDGFFSPLPKPGLGLGKRGSYIALPGTAALLGGALFSKDFMLGKNSAPSASASWSVLAMNPMCFVFAVG